VFIKTPQFIQSFFSLLVWRKDNSEKNIWLTFDDGPTPEITPFILQTLKDEDIKATFFLVGEQIETYPDLFQAIVKDGHLVANHSYSHKNGWISCNNTYVKDVEKCQEKMPNNTLFRPPYGKISPLQIKKLKTKFQIILWDVLSLDFYHYISPEKVKNNVLQNTKNGSIIVFHNNHKSFKNLKPILKETIQELKKKGHNFSTTW
jgi:peptidoglycan-N-acetylglucosamine deacetylase